MTSQGFEKRLKKEILNHVDSRQTLLLSTIDGYGHPFASYAPFAHDEESLYVLLSEIALHGKYLAQNPKASVLIVEDEDTAKQLFARVRVNYAVEAQQLHDGSTAWATAIDVLINRHGERIVHLSGLSDFKLFRLTPKGGRYVKGFGKAFSIEGDGLTGQFLTHLTEGHRKKPDTAKAS